MYDSRNVGATERAVSIGTAAALGAIAVRRGGAAASFAAAGTALLLYRGVTGFCPIYALVGARTRARTSEHNDMASVPYGTGIRVEHAIEVGKSCAELYAFWRRLDTLPLFMRHVDEVTVLTPSRSRWRVRAPIGSRVTWEAEIVNDVPDELIGWRSMPGSAVHHAGSVHFERLTGDLTRVRVVLEYAPPARYAGFSLARLFGEEPGLQIAADLARFKTLLETGQPAKRR